MTIAQAPFRPNANLGQGAGAAPSASGALRGLPSAARSRLPFQASPQASTGDGYTTSGIDQVMQVLANKLHPTGV